MRSDKPDWADDEVNGALTWANMHTAMYVASKGMPSFWVGDSEQTLMVGLELFAKGGELVACCNRELRVYVDMGYSAFSWCYTLTVGDKTRRIWGTGRASIGGGEA